MDEKSAERMENSPERLASWHHLRTSIRRPHGPPPCSNGGRLWDALPRWPLLLRPAPAAIISELTAADVLPLVRPPLEPNLYESGTVCLSLLNTFGGRSTELWSPESSTVLQVLVSTQSLVLTAQPYYNEAGYASQVGTAMGHRNDLPYSEKAYLLTQQTMMHLVRQPPAGFKDLVGDHFSLPLPPCAPGVRGVHGRWVPSLQE